MKFKKAFTMAEAILVMTILGIIATIMITTLKPAEFKDKGLSVLAKKVLSEIDNATTQILVNNTKLGTMATLVADGGGTEFTFKGNANAVMNFYKKYLTTIRTSVANNSFCKTGGTYNATGVNAVYLKDGACMGIYATANASAPTLFPGEGTTTINANATQGVIFFDTNGEDEPNTLGKDRFILPIAEEGIRYDK